MGFLKDYWEIVVIVVFLWAALVAVSTRSCEQMRYGGEQTPTTNVGKVENRLESDGGTFGVATPVDSLPRPSLSPSSPADTASVALMLFDYDGTLRLFRAEVRRAGAPWWETIGYPMTPYYPIGSGGRPYAGTCHSICIDVYNATAGDSLLVWQAHPWPGRAGVPNVLRRPYPY